jgi:hypothetical protein
MRLIELSMQYDGLYNVDVLVDNQEYSFSLSSEYAYRMFRKLAKHKPGAALNLLKKWNMVTARKCETRRTHDSTNTYP